MDVSLPAEVPRPLQGLVVRCLDKDPGGRPTASEAVSCLQGLLFDQRRPPADQRNPFRGLEYFGYEHRSIFFGRDAEVRELVAQLVRREAAGVPGALVEGASGWIL